MRKHKVLTAIVLTLVLGVGPLVWKVKPIHHKPKPVPTSSYYQPVPPAELMVASTLPRGVDFGCHIVWDVSPIHQACTVLLQPGTANDANNWVELYGAESRLAAIAIATLACTAAGGGLLGAICGAFAGLYATDVIHAVQTATMQARCVQFYWDVPLFTWPIPQALRIRAYGQPQNWRNRWYHFPWMPAGQVEAIWVWTNPDSCQTRNPYFCPSPGGWNDFSIPPCNVL